ncbi:MAG TPA: S9 family peptidase [Candidatus Krumholzibacteria bacterium]|nr:S9 family peptidase [Candidatus Krumholzibacteria bacterium]
MKTPAGFFACSAWLLLQAAPTLATEPASDLERSVTLMARIGFCNQPAFSPDGQTIAFASNMSGQPQIWKVAAAGGWPEAVTAFDDPVSGFTWSPDGAWIAFSLAPGGGLNEQVYLMRPDGTEVRMITGGGKENNRLGPWSRDGKLLTLGSNRRTPAAIDAYVYDLAGGKLRMVCENRGIGGFVDVSHDGRYALLQRVVSRGDNNLYRVELSTGREVLVTPHEPPGSFSGVLAPDGNSVYLVSNKDRDLRALARVRLSAAGEAGPFETLLARDDAELDGLTLDDAGKALALVWNVAGKSEIAFYDLGKQRQTPGPQLPAELAGGVEFSKDGRLLALTLSGSTHPADIWVYDLKKQTLRQLTQSPHAGVDMTQLVVPELVRYRAHDGLELSGWVYRPRQGKPPYPMVLSFHGGPEGQERPGFSSNYQALLGQGIAVFAPNVRGSSGFGKKFVNLDNGALRFDGIKDIKASVDYIVGAGVADPRRLGIMGGSYGGYMVMAGLTEYPDLFAAGANLFGVVNFATFFAHTEPWMAAISTIEYGDPATQADLLRQLSPIHKVDRVVAPTIVLHGANDTNVPVVEAEQVVENLKRRGVPVDYVLFPDEGHGWRKTPNRIRSTVAITQWFDRYLVREQAQR